MSVTNRIIRFLVGDPCTIKPSFHFHLWAGGRTSIYRLQNVCMVWAWFWDTKKVCLCMYIKLFHTIGTFWDTHWISSPRNKARFGMMAGGPKKTRSPRSSGGNWPRRHINPGKPPSSFRVFRLCLCVCYTPVIWHSWLENPIFNRGYIFLQKAHFPLPC